MRARLAGALSALGSLLLALGLLAGVVNHEVIDGARFAQHVDDIRQDPAVAQQLGRRLADRVLAADPDLVAIKPLVESVSVALVGSSAFSPIVRKSASELHAAFTQEEPAVLRLADVGAVLSGVLRQADPSAAARLPSGLDVTLSDIGSQSFASQSLEVVRVVHLLAWLLPVLAILCLLAAVGLADNRRAAAPRAGWAVTASGGLLVLIGVVVAVWTSLLDTGSLFGALTVATWHELRPAYWWTTAGTLVAGAVLAAAVETDPSLEPRRVARAGWQWVVTSTGSTRRRVGRGAVFVVAGVLLAWRPEIALTLAAAVVGVGVAVIGIEELVEVARERWAVRRREGRRVVWSPRLTRLACSVAGLVVIAGVLGVLARPADPDVPPQAVVSTGGGPCNGHVELCDRRYDEVAFPATHNSMSAADIPNWFLPEQPVGMVEQLDDGIRVLLIDTWYGQQTQRPGVVATSEQLQQTAAKQLEKDYGAALVDSALRLRDAANLTPTGPELAYLCHGYCELGAQLLEPDLERIAAWMADNPREVVTLFIQDEVSPADTAAAFDQAGLLPYVRTMEEGQPWPTLGEMISSGRRLVVLMEHRGGGAEYPWLLQGFDWVQDTPFDTTKQSQFSCALNRGSPDNPIFLVNHWLNNPQSRVSDARKVNAYDVLWPRVQQCQEERSALPNYVAVDFYDQGDLPAVVDRLNGFD